MIIHIILLLQVPLSFLFPFPCPHAFPSPNLILMTICSVNCFAIELWTLIVSPNKKMYSYYSKNKIIKYNKLPFHLELLSDFFPLMVWMD